jgi:protein SCO1/2
MSLLITLGLGWVLLAPPPEPSLLDDLTLDLRDANDRPVALAALKGGPVVLSMFYATCRHTCPMLVVDIKRIEAALAPKERAALKVVLVSLDPERDSGETLRQAVERYQLDPARWLLVRSSPEDVRTLAAVLGIKYKGMPNGEIAHSTVIAVLDPEGRVAHRLVGLMQPIDAVAASIRKWASR